ncbi:MAG: sulfatase [Candidatus Eisenbacteria bacterium]|nr:sulfatase [Candidatus Eisenbacteria bacterium]
MKRYPTNGRVAAAAIAAALALLSCGGEPPPRPNILLVSIESLRADHVGCYGYGRPTTPNVDRLAREGTVYRHAFSQTSWTLTSHATLFTGLYPTAHGVIEPRHRLGDSYRTLAETLAERGYQCAGFASGPFLRTPYNLHQGFEIWDDSPAAPDQESAHADITNPRMEGLLTSFLEEDRDPNRPFFLFAYLWDVHYDFLPPPPFDTLFVPEDAEPIDATSFETNPLIHPAMDSAALRWIVAQYDGEIRCTDELLGRLWDRMRSLGLWENTVIVVTADHGEEFFEHGDKGHKKNLFVETLHVPLVVKWADGRPAASDDRLAGLLDLFPTLARLGGGGPGDEPQGIDLNEPARGPEDPLFHELVTTFYGRGAAGRMEKRGEQWWAVRRGDYKLVSAPDRRMNLLFDAAADPRELHPIETERPELLERYLRLLAPWQSRMRAVAERHGEAESVRLSEEERERLEALGYVK